MGVNLYTRGNQRRINADWFTGKVRMKDVGEALEISGHDMYHVYFEEGSRTKLHEHNGDQILIVTEGVGSLELFSRESKKSDSGIKRMQKTSLKKGDVVYIPAKTLHTHGSSYSKAVFSHIAINIMSKRSTKYRTVWYESDLKKIKSVIK